MPNSSQVIESRNGEQWATAGANLDDLPPGGHNSQVDLPSASEGGSGYQLVPSATATKEPTAAFLTPPPPPPLPSFIEGSSMDSQSTTASEMVPSTAAIKESTAMAFIPPPPPPPPPSFINSSSKEVQNTTASVTASRAPEDLPASDRSATPMAHTQATQVQPNARQPLADGAHYQYGRLTTVQQGNPITPTTTYSSPRPATVASASPAPSPYTYGYGQSPLSRNPRTALFYSSSAPSSYAPSQSVSIQQTPYYNATQSAPSSGYRSGSSPAQTPQSQSMYASPSQPYPQSQTPRPASMYGTYTPVAPAPTSQYQGSASAPQSSSAPVNPNTMVTPYPSDQPTQTVASTGPRTPARKKADAFVANDPFRPNSNTNKADKPSDKLTFDDIPTAGSNNAIEPWTSQYAEAARPAQSEQTTAPSANSWYRPSEPAPPQQSSSSATPASPYSQATNSYPLSYSTPTSYPQYGSSPSHRSSEQQPQQHSSSSSRPGSSATNSYLPTYSTTGPYPSALPPSKTYPPSSPYSQYVGPLQPPVVVYPTQMALPSIAEASGVIPQTRPPRPGHSPPSSPVLHAVPGASDPQLLPQQPVEQPRADSPLYDPYNRAGTPLQPNRPYLDPRYPSYSPPGNYITPLPSMHQTSSVWSRIGKLIRWPFSSQRRWDHVFEPSHSDYSEDGYSKVAVKFIVGTVPSQLYLHFLLRLPSLYFSRVARIFEEADLTLPEIKKMALETASEGKSRAWDFHQLESKNVPPQYEKLKLTWESFIDSVMREWKTFNIISVLLLSAILTILQIDAAAEDPVTRYAALFSLICALISLLFGCMYIIRFGSMRKTYKAAEWALEAKRTKTVIWWNVWVLLAMPAIWLTWSIVLYIVCIMAFVWRSGSQDSQPPSPLSPQGLLTIRIIITIVLGLGFLYGCLILSTFRRYGEDMDRAWKERIDGWLEEQANTANQLPLPLPMSYNNYAPSVFQPSSYPPQYTEPSSAYPPGFVPYGSGYQPPFYSAPSYTDLGVSGGYSSNQKAKTNVRPNQPDGPSNPHHSPEEHQSRSSTPESTTSTVDVTRANTLQNKTAHLQRRESTSSDRSVIYKGPGYSTQNPLPLPPDIKHAIPIDAPYIPPPPRLVTKLAVPPPPSLPPIPGTPMTALSGRLSDGSLNTRNVGSTSAIGISYGDEDQDLQEPRVHFRSPLASAQGSDSLWGGSLNAASLHSDTPDSAEPLTASPGPLGRSASPSHESVRTSTLEYVSDQANE